MRTKHLKLAQLDELDAKLTRILDLYEEKIRYDSQKEKAFDTLYEELTMYKTNFVERSLSGVYKDLILLYDNVVRYLERLSGEDGEGAGVSQFGEFVLAEILEVLYRRGIELIEPSPESFDPSVQRAIEVVHTDDPQEDNKVLRVVRGGFQSDLGLVRPEDVIVAKYGVKGGETT